MPSEPDLSVKVSVADAPPNDARFAAVLIIEHPDHEKPVEVSLTVEGINSVCLMLRAAKERHEGAH